MSYKMKKKPLKSTSEGVEILYYLNKLLNIGSTFHQPTLWYS